MKPPRENVNVWHSSFFQAMPRPELPRRDNYFLPYLPALWLKADLGAIPLRLCLSHWTKGSVKSITHKHLWKSWRLRLTGSQALLAKSIPTAAVWLLTQIHCHKHRLSAFQREEFHDQPKDWLTPAISHSHLIALKGSLAWHFQTLVTPEKQWGGEISPHKQA